MTLPQAELDKFTDLVCKYQNFVLTCHTNADGDALGSTLALRKALVNQGKSAMVITPDLPPTYFAWMPDYKYIQTYEKEPQECDRYLEQADVILVLDYNDIKRVKSLGDKIASLSEKKTVMIDHHLDPQLKADVTFSYPEASATCELVYHVLVSAGMEQYIDVEVATALYTGILTDTGGLSYNSSNPELYLIVAELLRKGIDKPMIHENIFNNKTIRRLKLLGYTLGRKLKRIEKYPLTLMTLDAKELEQYGYHTGDTEGFVNYPLQVKDVIATAFIMERPDGVKISLRSKLDFPVNEFSAKYYGGGGHLNAAGGNYVGSLDEAVKIYTDNIVDFYAKWLKQHSK